MAYDVLFDLHRQRLPVAGRRASACAGISTCWGGSRGSAVSPSPVRARTSALVGEPISPPMATLIAEVGADAEGFAARQLPTGIVRGADLLITMTSAHRAGDRSPAAGGGPTDFRARRARAHAGGSVDAVEVPARSGLDASHGRATARAGRHRQAHRTPGVDPPRTSSTPTVGPRRSMRRARSSRAALDPLVRLAAPSSRAS